MIENLHFRYSLPLHNMSLQYQVRMDKSYSNIQKKLYCGIYNFEIGHL